jgi:dTDP-4-dehydrorhamnose reductase
MNRILIVGASGLVGSNLAVALREDQCVYGTYDKHKPNLTGVPLFKVDVLKESALFDVITLVRPNIVYYCAAIRDEQMCSEYALPALTINAEAAADIALCLRPLGGRLIYFSTSKVYSGQKGNYTEDDPTDPSSSYGEAKRRAEDLLLEFENTFILRLGTLYGFDCVPDRSLLSKLLKALIAKKEMTFINDEARDFHSLTEVVEASKRLLHADEDKSGLYNCPSAGKTTYYDFARHLAHAIGASTENITAISGEDLKAPYNTPETRGKDTTLNGEKFTRSFGLLTGSLTESLTKIADQLRTGLT